MSKIQQELCKATGVDASKYNNRAELHEALLKEANRLPDKDWEALSVPAQDWFNAAAEETKAAKAKEKTPNIQEFADYEPPSSRSSDEPRSRSRSRTDDEPRGGSAKGEETAVEKLQEGDRVKLTTKRGKSIEGVVSENSKRKEYVVVKAEDGSEDEVDYAKIDSVEVFHGTAGTQQDVGPEVGDEVEFRTKRGKTVSGVVTELTKDTIVIDKNDDYDIDRIDGDIKIVKKASGGGSRSSRDDEPRGRSSSRDDDSDKGSSRRGSSKDDDDDKKGRSSNPRGVSVGGRIRELLADDPDMKQAEIEKVMKKEGIEFREQTLTIIYRDTTNFIDMLRKQGKLKK